MEIFLQENYAEPSDSNVLTRLPEEALTIHKRSDDNESLAIFVHGLGGSRYGEDSTWGLFPQFLFEDISELDIGLYEYRTLLSRAKFWKSVGLSDEAEAFAAIIRDLTKYQTIFLIGHSMGGLLCMSAIAHLIRSQQKQVLSRVGGLILMATPQTGSQRVATPLSWLSKDFQALKPHGAFVTELQKTFLNNRVVLDDTRTQSGDILIPTWAVLGTSDQWVDKLSAGLNIPDSRQKPVRGTHKEIVKPASKTSDAYEYVRDRIKQVFLQQTGAFSTLSLPWTPLEEAFQGGTPNFFSMLKWNFRLVGSVIGRQKDLDAILQWAEANPKTPSARLITGEGGAGKTRLAATAAQILRDKGWTAGFLGPESDPFNVGHAPKGIFLIIDDPEEKPEQTKAVLKGLEERRSSTKPLRVLFLSRRSFEEWERETLGLEGRFGNQAISAAVPLSVDEALPLIEEAAKRYAAHANLPTPDFRGARQWLAASDKHRLPLYATAAAIHAVMEPKAAFGLSHAELLKYLTLLEIPRVQRASGVLGLGREGLERLLALGVLADGLSESAVVELAKAGVCDNPPDIVSRMAETPWWKAGRLARLEPDAPAAAFLNFALFEPNNFPNGRDALSDWMFTALRQNAPTFGGRLGRILYDLDNLRALRPEKEQSHPLEDRLDQMITEHPERVEAFTEVSGSEAPFWSAKFATLIASILARRSTDQETKARHLNNAATYLSKLGRREEALAAAREAADLYRNLARARPEAFIPDLAMALNNLANRFSDLGLREEAFSAAQESVNIRRNLARAHPEAFAPKLAMSLNSLSNRLSDLGCREEALSAAQEAADLYRNLSRVHPEAFTPDLALSLNNLANTLSDIGRREEALSAAREAADLYRNLSRARPEAFTPHLAVSLNNLANRLANLDRGEEALPVAQEAVQLGRDLARARPEAFTPDLALSLNNLANRLAKLDRGEEALSAAREAADLYRNLAQTHPEAFTPDLAMSLNTLGNRLSKLDRREEALPVTQEATDLYRNLARARPEAFKPDLALSLNNLANCLSDLGRREEGLAVAQEAADLYRNLARARPEAFTPNLATLLDNLSIFLSALDRREEAVAASQEAVTLRRDLARTRPETFTPDLALSLNNLARSLSDLGRREDVLAAIEEAVKIYRDLARARPEPFTPDLAGSLNNLANCLSDLGRREEALAAAQEAADLYRDLARAGPEAFTLDLAGSLHNLGKYLSDLGRREEALTAAQEAADLYRDLALAGPEAFTPDLAGALNDLANCLSDLGRREEALSAAQEAVKLSRDLAQARPDAYKPYLAATLETLGALLSTLGRREEALSAAQEAAHLFHELTRAHPEVFIPDLATSLNTLANCLSALGREDEARMITQEAEALKTGQFGYDRIAEHLTHCA